jgi:hypothetical protein
MSEEHPRCWPAQRKESQRVDFWVDSRGISAQLRAVRRRCRVRVLRSTGWPLRGAVLAVGDRCVDIAVSPCTLAPATPGLRVPEKSSHQGPSKTSSPDPASPSPTAVSTNSKVCPNRGTSTKSRSNTTWPGLPSPPPPQGPARGRSQSSHSRRSGTPKERISRGTRAVDVSKSQPSESWSVAVGAPTGILDSARLGR